MIKEHHYGRICRRLTIRGQTVKDCRCRSKCCDRGKENEYVCGSNHCSYPTACHLHQHACETGKRILIKKRGTCNINKSPDDCPSYAQIAPSPSNVTVYLNASEIMSWAIKVRPCLEAWIDWNKVNRVIKGYEASASDLELQIYAQLFNSLEVFDAFGIIEFSRKPLSLYEDYVRERRVYSLESLLMESTFHQFSAIADAFSFLSKYELGTKKECSCLKEKIFNAAAFLPCEVKNTLKVIWFRNGTELVDGVKYKILTNGLLIENVRPIDADEYTCKAFGPFESIATATAYLEVKGTDYYVIVSRI